MWQGVLVGLGFADPAAWQAATGDAAVSWPEVLEEAGRLRLRSFLHLGLAAASCVRAQVPRPVAESLRRTACAAAVRATQLERLCATIVAEAARAGIPALVLKGPAMASLVYPSAAVRPMDDVDLLVSGEDRERLADLLRSSGFRNDLRGEEDFFSPSRDVSIDVHTGLVNTTRVPARRALWPMTFDQLWACSQTVVLGNVPARTLSPRDTLLHLAIHTVHHQGFGGMLWMVDLLACLRAWSFSPDDMEDAPPAVRRSLWYCLEVLASRGQDPVPSIRAAVQPDRVHLLEQWALAAIAHGEVPAAIRYAFTLACLSQWKAKGAFLRQLLFPRAGVFTNGFKDAGNSAPSRGEHWCLAIQLCREALRAALASRTQSSKKGGRPS